MDAFLRGHNANLTRTKSSVLFQLGFRSMKGKSVFFFNCLQSFKTVTLYFLRGGMPQCSVAVNFQPEVMTSIPNYIYQSD